MGLRTNYYHINAIFYCEVLERLKVVCLDIYVPPTFCVPALPGAMKSFTLFALSDFPCYRRARPPPP